MNADRLRQLKPFFRPQGGSITGAQGSGQAVAASVTPPPAQAAALRRRRCRPTLAHRAALLPAPAAAAGNASPISDGAAAVVLASGSAVRRLGLPVLGRVRGFGDAAVDPRDFPTAPTLAIPKALQHAGALGARAGCARGARCACGLLPTAAAPPLPTMLPPPRRRRGLSWCLD